MEIKDNRFNIDKSEAAKKELALHINDNVFKNLETFSLFSYDKELTWSKDEFSAEEKKRVVENFIKDNLDDKEQLDKSLDRILIAHRNTKLFLFLLSGPFFIIFSLIKYGIKFCLIYFIFKKGKSASGDK